MDAYSGNMQPADVEARRLRLAAEKNCKDWHNNCPLWAFDGECEANASWMRVQCPRSCHTCAGAPVRGRPGPAGHMTPAPALARLLHRCCAHGVLHALQGPEVHARTRAGGKGAGMGKNPKSDQPPPAQVEAKEKAPAAQLPAAEERSGALLQRPAGIQTRESDQTL